MSEGKLRWISSSGGPLILLPAERVEEWEGVDPPSAGRVVDAKSQWNPDQPPTDYDLACDVDELIANVDVGAGRGIVLGGEPYATCVWTESSRILLARWVSAESEEEIVECLREEHEFSDGVVALIEARPGPLVLFDSACPGREIEEDKIALDLHPGFYVASAIEVKAGDETQIVLIQLEPGN